MEGPRKVRCNKDYCDDTRTSWVPLRMSVGREEEKDEDLQMIIIILLLLELIVRSREESQDDIVLRSDWTTCREEAEDTGWEKGMLSA